jgi:hypothetical protein
MTLEGKIAVANMLLVAAAFLVYSRTLTSYGSDAIFPEGVLVLAALTFPVGWLGWYLMARFCDQPLLAVVLAAVFVVLNAYFWGHVLAKLVRAVRDRISWG